MSEAMPPATGDQFTTEYSIYADTLQVDLLLAQATPVSSHSIWRVGEVTEFGPARSSGITIPVFQGGSLRALHGAVRDFLAREQGFLKAAQAFVRDNVACSLSTSVCVLVGHLPVHVDLPASLLRTLAEYGIDWSVVGFPCSADGGIAVGDAPSNNEMQRTRPAQAMKPRR